MLTCNPPCSLSFDFTHKQHIHPQKKAEWSIVVALFFQIPFREDRLGIVAAEAVFSLGHWNLRPSRVSNVFLQDLDYVIIFHKTVQWVLANYGISSSELRVDIIG